MKESVLELQKHVTEADLSPEETIALFTMAQTTAAERIAAALERIADALDAIRREGLTVEKVP